MIQLELAKTRLRIEDGNLVQLNANGNPIMHLPLAEVRSLRFRKVVEPMGLAILTLALLIFCVGHFVCEHNLLKSLLYLAAVLIAGFGLLGLLSDRIHVRTQDGEVWLHCVDDADAGEAFVLSAHRLLHRWQERAQVKERPAEAVSAGQPVAGG